MATLRCNPTDSVRQTSPYGPRNYAGLEFHPGMDIGATVPGQEGDNLYSVADGTVRVAKANAGNPATGYGYYVVIEHSNYCSLYGHLQRLEVKEGQKVKAGEIIGHMGYTGDVYPKGAGGTHLHFEIRECNYSKFWEKGDLKGSYKYAIDPQPLLLKNVLSITEALNIIKKKRIYDNDTIEFMLTHPWPQNFLDKFVKNIK